jgi:hypothetical protein
MSNEERKYGMHVYTPVAPDYEQRASAAEHHSLRPPSEDYIGKTNRALFERAVARKKSFKDGAPGFALTIHRLVLFAYALILPFAFRFTIAAVTESSSGKTYGDTYSQRMKLFAFNNAVTCVDCSYTSGETVQQYSLSQISFTYTNLVIPGNSTGSPGYWLFASQDFDTWFNLYTPSSAASNYFTTVSRVGFKTITIDDSSELACVGSAPGG